MMAIYSINRKDKMIMHAKEDGIEKKNISSFDKLQHTFGCFSIVQSLNRTREITFIQLEIAFYLA